MEWSQDDLIEFALAQEEEEEPYNNTQNNNHSNSYDFHERDDYEFIDEEFSTNTMDKERRNDVRNDDHALNDISVDEVFNETFLAH